jgi:hypothetical protein
MWKITGASVIGSDHGAPGKNNQDALFMYRDQYVTVGIVCDGCGKGIHSEVGSKIGAQYMGRLVVESVHRAIELGGETVSDFERLRMLVLGQISVLARAMMEESFSRVISNYFLFSIVGFAITPKTCTVFHIGDGMYAVNGEIAKMGPFPENKPPYIMYGLDGGGPIFQTVAFPTESVQSLAVGTDGTDYIPNLNETLAEWTTSDGLFLNSDNLRRRLASLNARRKVGSIDAPGLLRDDTTLVIARNFMEGD